MSKKLTTEEFIARATNIHGDKYNYDKACYTQSRGKVTIYCNEHKEYFEQEAIAHTRGQGCPKCGIEITNIKNTDNTASFIKKAQNVHSNKYTYEYTEYTKIINQVDITCPHHGVFKQRPVNHLQGKGCQACANNKTRAKYLNEPTILYQVYFPLYNLYKIGITLARIGTASRFYGETNIEILDEVYFLTGKYAYEVEKSLLTNSSAIKHNGKDILKKGGNSELLTKQIKITGNYNEQHNSNND